MNTQIIAIANQKGGVGKTTTCANLGIGLAQAGKKVLLIDGDPQGSLTISLGNPQPDKLPFTLSDAMGKILMDQPIRPGEGILHHAEGVDLMPADIQLSGMEVSLVNAMSRETILRQYLDTLKGQYSHILIDCQPSLGMLTVNALAAANRIIIPVQAEYLPAKGLEQLLSTVNKVKRQINPKLQIDGILLTMVDSRTNFAKEISALLRETYGSKIKVFGTEIPHSVRAKEISAEGKSIFAHDPGGKVAEGYRNLTKEVLKLEKQREKNRAGLLRVAIDNALSQSPADFEELLKLLQEYGCEVSKRGKSYRLKLSGWEKAARMDSLGEGYGLEDLRAVLSGKKAHTPRKKTVTQAEPPKVNLLVDIQAKLQAGKGAGYARWAKVFNLKQMAQTMNYLSENNLLEYAVLEEKAAAATAHHNELSAHIKAAEKRMAEIAVLRTHIVNYAKTREVYVAYRKAGYSKKFREEHEEEILLHQAAKNAFDEMGVKKLPKVKELQTEYAKLLEEKKKTYSEYRRSREEMRELLTAKANVDRVLKMEVEQDVEKEKDHGQR